MNLQENPKKEAFIIHASSFISPGWVPVPSVWLMLLLNKLLPHLSFHAASLEKMRSWSSLEVTQLSFSLFPCCHSYCGQLKEWTEINISGYQNRAKLMGCSALSFIIKSFSDNDFFLAAVTMRKSNFSRWGAGRPNPAWDLQFVPVVHPETPECDGCKLKNVKTLIGSMVCILWPGQV